MPFIIEKERDPLYKDGLQKGIEQGQEEGLKKVEETKHSIARKMLKEKLDITLIAEITGLSTEEIEKLAQKG